MSRSRSTIILGLLVAISMLLASCGPAQTATPVATSVPVATNAPAATSAPAATNAPAATQAPAATSVPQTTRKGGWLDEIDFSVVTEDSAVTQIQAGAIDMYSDGLAAADFPSIQEAGLPYVENNGLQYDILYNPGVCKDTNILNPFSDPKIREATNWLYDRNYINQEIYAGADLLKFFPITTQFPAYANLADVAAALETQYAFNPDKAKSIITDEMKTLGANQAADGKWQYKGKPVTLDFLIRIDSDGTRKPLGDYVASQLESVGFTINREYKKATEAAPIWQSTPPADCQWTLYTSAWSATIIDREERTLFQQYYTPESSQAIEPLSSSTPDPVFEQLANDIANGNYTSLEQRDQMMSDALKLALKDSLQVWLIDGKNFIPYKKGLQVVYDLAGGIQGAQLWAYTTRYAGQEGGTLKIGEQDMFGQPYNPVGGSNWAYDQMAIRATISGGTMNDPYTGLVWPLNLQKATVTVKQGLPVSKTLDWVTLETAPSITVPTDALADWDAKAQKFISVGDKYPDGVTANVKSEVVYPSDLFSKVAWSDNSNMDAADFLMGMILQFDRANPDSAIYDASVVPYFQSFMQSFKGFRITSTAPLTIEFYTNVLAADAELDVTTFWPGPSACWWSPYVFGEGAWHVLAVADLAEAAGEVAYSTDKSTEGNIEWTNFVGGPSLDVLSKYLDQAITDKYIPYAATLGQYITADQAVARYQNLKDWYKAHGNYWIGTGPYYLDRAYVTEKTLTLKHNDQYPYLADRWSGFGDPKIATVNIDGPAQVKIGDQAEFDISVDFKDAPYPAVDIKSVKFLVFDANGTVVATAAASSVAEGQYKATLTSEITNKLVKGSNQLVVVVVPLAVAIPTFTSINFVTLAP
jgi:peptide/nickel transport system substrate-binding protein